MSKKTTIEDGMDLVTSFIDKLTETALSWGKIHPYNSLLLLNLVGNVSYTLLEDEEELAFSVVHKLGEVVLAGKTFEDRKRALAFCFRRMAVHSGQMMDAQKAHHIFGTFNMGKLTSSLAGLLK